MEPERQKHTSDILFKLLKIILFLPICYVAFIPFLLLISEKSGRLIGCNDKFCTYQTGGSVGIDALFLGLLFVCLIILFYWAITRELRIAFQKRSYLFIFIVSIFLIGILIFVSILYYIDNNIYHRSTFSFNYLAIIISLINIYILAFIDSKHYVPLIGLDDPDR